MARPLGPQDLDPLDAAAAPIPTDPEVRRKMAERARRHQQLMSGGMSEEQAASAMIAEDRARMRRSGPAPLAPDIRSAVGRGSLYPEEAELVAREREIEDSADSLGLPRVDTLPPAMRDAASGDDMIGRFRFVHSPTGLRAVDTSPSEAEQRASFTRWANAEPGSDRQRQYSPAGAAAWDARVAGNISRWAQEDLAVSADPELAAARRAKEKEAFDERIARRDFLENDPRTQAIREKTEERNARLQNNLRMVRQNPILTLGDPGLNEWQQFVLAQNMLGGRGQATDPNAVRATHNEQALRLAERFGLGQGFPEPTPEAKAIADAKAREANPRAAGVRDIGDSNFETAEAQAELDALARQHDTTIGGFSYEDERNLAARLQKPPYNMSPEDAAAYAYRAAERQRWWWNQGGGPAGTRGAGAVPAPPAAGADPAAGTSAAIL